MVSHKQERGTVAYKYAWKHSSTYLYFMRGAFKIDNTCTCMWLVLYHHVPPPPFSTDPVFQLISRRRFSQIDVLEGLNVLIGINGRKNKLRVYYLSWLKQKILKGDEVRGINWNIACQLINNTELLHVYDTSHTLYVYTYNIVHNVQLIQ